MIFAPAWILTVVLLAQGQTPAPAAPQQPPAGSQPAAQQQATQQPPTPLPPAPDLPLKSGIPPRDPRLPAPQTAPTTLQPPVLVPTVTTAGVTERPLTANEAARIALRLQPNIVIARAGIASQRGTTRQIRSSLLPQLTVFGSYGYVSTLHQQSGTGPVGVGAGSTGTGSTGTGSGGSTNAGTGSGNTGSGSGGSTGSGGSAGGSGSGGSTGSSGSSGSSSGGNAPSGSGSSSGNGSSGSGSGSTTAGSVGSGNGRAGGGGARSRADTDSTGTGSTGSTGTTGSSGTSGTGSTSSGGSSSTGSTGTGSTGSTGSTGASNTGGGNTGANSNLSIGGGVVANPGSGTSSQTVTSAVVSGGTTGSSSINPGTGISSVPTAISSAYTDITLGLTAEVSLHQLIYDFNHTRDLVRQSVALELAAARNLTRVQSDTVYQVKLAFYQYVQNAQLVQVDQDNLANRQAQLNQALARYNVGQGLQADVVSAETAKAEAIQILNTARSNETLARANLALLMGIDPRTPIVPAATGEPIPPVNDMNVLVQQALQHRPEILVAQSSLDAARYGVNAARSNNAPVISGSLNVESTGNQFVPQNDYLIAGVAVTFTPFDGGLTTGRVEQARANVTIAQAQLSLAQITVKSDVMQAYVDLNTAEQNVVAATADVINAQQGVRIAEGRYSTGLGQFLDILNAQAFLLTAQTSLTQARSTVDQARAELNHAIGTPVAP